MATFNEASWPPDSRYAADYHARVDAGRIRMKDASVVICGLARDIGHLLPCNLEVVERIGAMFGSWKSVFYENDSVDDTQSRLFSWAAAEPASRFVRSEAMAMPKWGACRDQGRTAHMARYREQNRLDAINFAVNADYAIVLDLDLHAYSLDGLANTFGHPGWNCMASNGLARHKGRWIQYDAFAWRDKSHPAPMTAAQVNPRVLPRGQEPIPVMAAFGGMACYRMDAYRSSSYEGYTCEHVPFQLRMQSVLVNPSQIVLYTPG